MNASCPNTEPHSGHRWSNHGYRMDCPGVIPPDPPVAVPGPADPVVSPADTPAQHLAVTFKCPHCDGDGYIDRWLEDSEGRDFPVSIPCERCGGTGELRDDGEDDHEE